MNDMIPLTASKSKYLTGDAHIPGDKSISHRALMFGALAIGQTTIAGLLEGEDVMATANAMRKMGAKIEKKTNNIWHIHGVGIGGLQEPTTALEMGNSGTSTRLLIGLVGGHNITATFTGDASLSGRPMNRVIKPLEQMGATFQSRQGGKLPLTITGAQDTLNIKYRLPIASAQVKSAILLAGLNARGTTTIIEEKPTRDHTENMLQAFGIDVQTTIEDDGAYTITLEGQQEMTPCHITIPADPSSAAFPAVAAAITKDSHITLKNVGIGARRNGLYLTLQDMGADIEFTNKRIEGGEEIADIVVKGNQNLKGTTVPQSRVPSMIDEFPILAVAAACANGTTYMSGLEELRVKESDRLLMMYQGLKSCGVNLEMTENTLTIHGTGTPPMGTNQTIKTALDHRIAMAFMVLGGVSQTPITIDDEAPIRTSFPNFIALMNSLGCQISSKSDKHKSHQKTNQS